MNNTQSLKLKNENVKQEFCMIQQHISFFLDFFFAFSATKYEEELLAPEIWDF